MRKFLEQLQSDALCWFSENILAEFSQHTPKVILGNFHLSSREGFNCMQVELLGVIIYYLLEKKKDYRFIFGGDFNSYVAVD